MKIQLKRDPRAAFEEIEVEKGTTIETIYKRIEHELPYKIVAAKVNYKYEGLTYALHRECRVELLDMAHAGGESGLSEQSVAALSEGGLRCTGRCRGRYRKRAEQGTVYGDQAGDAGDGKGSQKDPKPHGGAGQGGLTADQGGAQQGGGYRVF